MPSHMNVETWENILSSQDILDYSDVPSKASVALQSQYATSPRIQGLGRIFHEEIDCSEELDTLYQLALNLETAEGTFLDWLGARVGVTRTNEVNGIQFTFDDLTFRKLIRYRASANISSVSAEKMQIMLNDLLGTQVKVTDHQDMTMTVSVNENVGSEDMALLKTFGIILKPAGVGVNLNITSASLFGFNGQKLAPFNLGVLNTIEE